jgi:hypothetical protein
VSFGVQKKVIYIVKKNKHTSILLPEATIKEIERMMNSFWWGGVRDNKGIRWLA